MIKITRSQYELIKSAYRTMATAANYRPAAPNDGFGNITTPAEELDLEREADQYAAHWLREEKTHDSL
jgi:hypothetical protein